MMHRAYHEESVPVEPAMGHKSKTSNTKNFFIVGADSATQARKVGLYPALAQLVLSRGSGPDHRTTSWRANSVADRCGIRWDRAQSAIDALAEAELVRAPDHEPRQGPPLKLASPEGDSIWLPNSLVDGIGGSRPLVSIRETRSTLVLELLLELYRHQNLVAFHGVNHDWLWWNASVSPIEESGPYNLWAANIDRTRTVCARTPITEPFDHDVARFWETFKILERLRLLEWEWYAAEPDGELLFPLDEEIVGRSREWMQEQDLGRVTEHEDATFLFTTLRHQPQPEVIGVCRTKFRAHTRLTAQWWAEHQDMKRRKLDSREDDIMI